jgi:hypothetical protein
VIVTLFVSPCLIVMLDDDILIENVPSASLIMFRPESLRVTPGPPGVLPPLSQPTTATRASKADAANRFFIVFTPFVSM